MNRQRDYWDSLAGQPLDASVIDPNDTRGRKNHYLAGIRNRLILKHVSGVPKDGIVLDLGCGTGSLSQTLGSGGHAVVGVDISPGLLRRTRDRNYMAPAVFIRYDGTSLPLADASIDAVATYVVLTHVMAEEELSSLLGECLRVLRPGSLMVCMEQCRRREQIDREGWKHFRTRDQWLSAFRAAGFLVEEARTVRFGRFPMTQLVRFGLVPTALFGALSWVEQALGRLLTSLPWGYSDLLFVMRKPKA